MFKKLWLTFLLGFFFFEISGSELKRAEKYFLQGDYLQAVSILQKINVSHPHFIVDYNLGLCYWKLNDLYQARKYLLRALLRDSTDPHLLDLLKKVNQKLGLNESKKEFFVESVLAQKVRSVFCGTVLKFSLWGSFYLLNLFIFLKFFGKKFSYKVMVLAAIVFLLLMIVALSGYRQEKIIKRGIVVVDTFLLAQPEENGIRLDRVKKAMAFKMIQRNGNWLQVLVENSYAGWISADKVELF